MQARGWARGLSSLSSWDGSPLSSSAQPLRRMAGGGVGNPPSRTDRAVVPPLQAPLHPPQPYTETDSRVRPQTSLGCQALRGGLPWPICKTSSLPQAEQKGGKVDSQNPGSNLHLAGPGETPTRPRLNRDQAQPFECQSVSPPSPRATGGGGSRRSGPSRGSPVLALWDVANQKGQKLRAEPQTQLDPGLQSE